MPEWCDGYSEEVRRLLVETTLEKTTPIKTEPSYINNMMFEPFILHEDELININSISRCYKDGGMTKIECKGREGSLIYLGHTLYETIKAKLGL